MRVEAGLGRGEPSRVEPPEWIREAGLTPVGTLVLCIEARLMALGAADEALDVAVDALSSSWPMLLLRLRLPPVASTESLLEMFLNPRRNFARNDDDFVTAAATSSFETVTDVCAFGSVLASQSAGSAMPLRMKGWRCG